MAHQKLLYTHFYRLKQFSRSFSLAKANPGIYSDIYEAYIKYPKLTIAQKNTLKTEDSLSSKQELTELCWSNLKLSETNLRDVQYNLDPLSAVDSRYPKLLQHEVHILERLRHLDSEFHRYHADEAREMSALTTAVHGGIVAQHATERRMQQFVVISVALGLLLGLAFVRCGQMLVGSGAGEGGTLEDLKALVRKIVDGIRSNDSILFGQLEDLRVIAYLHGDPITSEALSRFSDEAGKNDELFLSEAIEILSDVEDKGKTALDQMVAVEEGFFKRKHFEGLPTLIVDRDPMETSRDERGLWVTICAYVSAAVIVPIALVAMA